MVEINHMFAIYNTALTMSNRIELNPRFIKLLQRPSSNEDGRLRLRQRARRPAGTKAGTAVAINYAQPGTFPAGTQHSCSVHAAHWT